jgi:hypothetical protein
LRPQPVDDPGQLALLGERLLGFPRCRFAWAAKMRQRSALMRFPPTPSKRAAMLKQDRAIGEGFNLAEVQHPTLCRKTD